MNIKNQDIRQAAAVAGIRLWQIADKLGISDCNFSRRLRRELDAEEKNKVLSVIEELSREAI